MFSRCTCVFALLAAGLLMLNSASAQERKTKTFTEQDVITLLELTDEETVLDRLGKAGVSFDATEEALARLKDAGASQTLLEAVKKAAAPKTPPAGVVTFQEVCALLEQEGSEQKILERLSKSPTRFVLAPEQKAELRKFGASSRLIAALEGERPQQQNSEILDFVLILDCSGSMKESISAGATKMEVARQTVLDLIDRVPEGRRLALVVYGHDEALKCQAVKVIRKMSVLDGVGKSDLARQVSALRPVGSTPIALALKTAGEALDPQAPSTMLLISDGVETCQGDPAGEAAELAAKYNLTFGVVGFDVKADERRSLEAIAKAGKGKYYDARSAAELLNTTAEIAHVDRGGVTDPIEVWVEKDYASSENPLHTEFIVNGKTVDIFSSSTRKPIAKFLQSGWNNITLVTRPQTPAKVSNGLTFRIGPVVKDSKSGQPMMKSVLWKFTNDEDWKLEDGGFQHPLGPNTKEVTLTHRVYYAGLEREIAPVQKGDYVIQGTPDYDSAGQPLTATVFVNGTPLNSFVPAARQVVITPLLKLGRNEVKLVSTRVQNAMSDNDITIDVVGHAEYRPRDQRWLVQPILSLEAMQGWRREEASGQLASSAAKDGETIERSVTFYVDQLPGQMAEVEPLSPADGEETATPVSDPIEIWVEKNYASSENPLHSELIINGRTVDVFSSKTRKRIAQHLRQGWNTIAVTTTPQTPANGANSLIFEIGPVIKDPKSGEPTMAAVLWQFRNDTDWKFDDGEFQHPRAVDAKDVTLQYRMYYSGMANEPVKIAEGDYVLQGEANYQSSNVPVAATLYINGRPLNSFLGGKRQVVVTPLLKQGKNEIKLVTHAVTDAFSDNEITFDLGGPSKYNARKMNFEMAPIVQFRALEGWERSDATGQLINSGDPNGESIERTISFYLNATPKNSGK